MSRVLLVVVMWAISSLAASAQTKPIKHSPVRHKDPSLREHAHSSVTSPYPAHVNRPNAMGKSGETAKTSSAELASLEKQTLKAEASNKRQKASHRPAVVGQKQAKGDRNLPINFKGSTPGKTTKLQSSGAKQGQSPRLGHKGAKLH